MQAAEHGATFPMATKVRASMTHAQLHDFAVGSEKGKPLHAPHPHRNLGPALKRPVGGEFVTNHHRGAKKP